MFRVKAVGRTVCRALGEQQQQGHLAQAKGAMGIGVAISIGVVVGTETSEEGVGWGMVMEVGVEPIAYGGKRQIAKIVSEWVCGVVLCWASRSAERQMLQWT